MKYKGIIFDFNGVILWDSPWHEQAWKEVSKHLRDKEFTDEEMALHVHGRTNKHTFSYLTGKDIADNELERFIQLKEGKYRSTALSKGDEFALSPGAEELFEFLVANDIPHTIATASEITNLKFFIEHLHLDKWFEFEKIVYDDGQLPGKPEPDIYLRAAENLQLNPIDCIVVEDAKSGIQAAHSASIGKIIAIGPKEKHNELSQLTGVSEVIEKLSDIDTSIF